MDGKVNVLTFYIVREIIKGSLIAWVLLLTLINLFTFSDELKSLGTGNYGLKEIFYYLALTSPRVMANSPRYRPTISGWMVTSRNC